MRSLILWIAPLISATAAIAYPIPPAPLWRIVAKADAIVVARVVAVDESVPVPLEMGPDDERDPDATIDVARLAVVDVWKGDPGADLRVYFEGDMACPAPARYDPGETVVAFLASSDVEGAYFTVSLSYGTRYVEPKELATLKARTLEALALQAGERVERVDRIEWLVRCSERAATRWDGLYELIGSPKPTADDNDGDELRIPPAELLTDEHRARMAGGFVDDPKLDFSLVLLLEVLNGFPSARLDAALVRAIDAELAGEDPDVDSLRWFMPRILDRLGSSVDEERFGEASLEDLRKLWMKARGAKR